MARVHGISGCTKYLQNGTRSINGKSLETVDEFHHLFDHYEKILDETEGAVAQQYDEIILSLNNDESRLGQRLEEGIANRTKEVDRHIQELNDRINKKETFFARTGCRIHYWVALSLRNHNIKSHFSDSFRELRNIQNHKKKQIENKASNIKKECNNVVSSYSFLKSNYTFLIGADGEELVISILSHLPDDYHVINDVNLYFNRAIHWRERDEYIKNCQIDHIVSGPTGIFLLETKNWRLADIELKSDELKHQVRRSNLALWYYLKDYYRRDKRPKVRNVIVSINGSTSGRNFDRYIDVVTPHELCRYITARKAVLSKDEISKLIKLIA